jgi:hypothetical protein
MSTDICDDIHHNEGYYQSNDNHSGTDSCKSTESRNHDQFQAADMSDWRQIFNNTDEHMCDTVNSESTEWMEIDQCTYFPWYV